MPLAVRLEKGVTCKEKFLAGWGLVQKRSAPIGVPWSRNYVDVSEVPRVLREGEIYCTRLCNLGSLLFVATYRRSQLSVDGLQGCAGFVEMAEVLILDAAQLSDVGNFLFMPRAVDQHIAFRALQEIGMRVDRSKRYFQFCLPQIRVYFFRSLFLP